MSSSSIPLELGTLPTHLRSSPFIHVFPLNAYHMHLHARIRDVRTTRPDFVFYADQLLRALLEFALSKLEYEPLVVTTPTQTQFAGAQLVRSVCGVSILRAGESMERALRSVAANVTIGKILVQRDESDPERRAKLFYSKLPAPAELHASDVFLLDPMLATGHSLCTALSVLVQQHNVAPERIWCVNLMASVDGIELVREQFPHVHLVIGIVEKRLNEDKYLIPGLGDFGDRYFGT